MEYLQSNGFIKPLLFQSNSGSGIVSFIIIIYIKFIEHFKDIKFNKKSEIKFTCIGPLEKDCDIFVSVVSLLEAFNGSNGLLDMFAANLGIFGFQEAPYNYHIQIQY